MKDLLLNVLISLLCGVVAIPCAMLVLRFSGWYENYIENKAQSRIGWWLLSSGKDMLYHIQNTCVGCIGTEYLIKESEREIAFEIIEAFQANSKHLYFNPNNKLARKTHSEVFMYYFEKYLNEHDNYYFNGNEMYVEEQNTNSVAKCSITEYGIVYTKLFYMALLFCEKNPKLNANNDYWSEGIKKKLDTKQTTFYHHN